MTHLELRLPDGRVLPAEVLDMSFARGGGPGGQHVNKTESKVDLRLDLTRAQAWLGTDDVARIRERWPGRLDAEGRLFVHSSEHKSRWQNVQAALERMTELVARALQRRTPRRPTRPTRGSVRRRLEDKRRRSEHKQQRRPPAAD
jgi:ribosome-associated protein